MRIVHNKYTQEAQLLCLYFAKQLPNVLKKQITNRINTLNFMDELEFIRNRRAAEHHYGDVRKACERAKVAPPVFQSAIKKKNIDDLTDNEILVIRAFIEVLDERKAEKELLKKSVLC